MVSEQPVLISGPVGDIESIVHFSGEKPYSRFGVVCHPHPLYQGSMHNKVVATVVRAFNKMHFPCIRFNYRGVGKSLGTYADAVGEVEDCLAVLSWVNQQAPQAKIWLAGFSFGAYIAACVASKEKLVAQLLTIAPSVERMPYAELSSVSCPWLTIQGDEDEVVAPVAVYQWFEQLQADKTLIKFPATTHFFHGKLVKLREEIVRYYEQQ